jgi:hypothetical protein
MPPYLKAAADLRWIGNDEGTRAQVCVSFTLFPNAIRRCSKNACVCIFAPRPDPSHFFEVRGVTLDKKCHRIASDIHDAGMRSQHRELPSFPTSVRSSYLTGQVHSRGNLYGS